MGGAGDRIGRSLGLAAGYTGAMVGQTKWGFLLAWLIMLATVGAGVVQEPDSGELELKELRALTFEYALGPRLHRAHVTEPKALAAMTASLRIVGRDPAGAKPVQNKILGHLPVMILDMGEGQRHSFHIAGRNQLHSKRWGRVTLAPDFFQVLEAWISELEHSRVRLNVENPFPEDRLERLFAFQELDNRPWQEAEIQGPENSVHVHGPQALTALQDGYGGIYVPATSVPGESWGYEVELRTWVGDPIGFTLVDGTRCVTRPLHATLLRHETLGAVWVDDTFRDVLLDLHTPRFPVPEGFVIDPEEGLKSARKAVEALLSGPSQTLLFRSAQQGQPGQQHLWSIPLREVRGSLGEVLLPSNLRMQRETLPTLRENWSRRARNLASLSWRDSSGVRWDLYQRSAAQAWLAPQTQWSDVDRLWGILQEAVR